MTPFVFVIAFFVLSGFFGFFGVLTHQTGNPKMAVTLGSVLLAGFVGVGFLVNWLYLRFPDLRIWELGWFHLSIYLFAILLFLTTIVILSLIAKPQNSLEFPFLLIFVVVFSLGLTFLAAPFFGLMHVRLTGPVEVAADTGGIALFSSAGWRFLWGVLGLCLLPLIAFAIFYMVLYDAGFVTNPFGLRMLFQRPNEHGVILRISERESWFYYALSLLFGLSLWVAWLLWWARHYWPFFSRSGG